MEGKTRRIIPDILISIFFYLIIIFICKSYETTANSVGLENQGKFPEDGGRYNEVRSRPLTRETKSKYLKKLAEGLYNHKRNPHGGDEGVNLKGFLSRGWGPGGMPFNVLYTPNSPQQKVLRSVPKISEESRKVLEEPKSYDLVLGVERPPPHPQRGKLKKLSTPRKYYSVIPHFFVSYGWSI